MVYNEDENGDNTIKIANWIHTVNNVFGIISWRELKCWHMSLA